MIYSRSAEYAIRAFVRLAQVSEGRITRARQIAELEGIPAPFLAKILQQLTRSGQLRSSKGPTGGFALRLPAEAISLRRIVEALDGLEGYRRCPIGLAECTDQAPCGMHDSWKSLRSRIMDYWERTTIADLAKELEQKRRMLEKPRRLRRSAARKS